MLARRAGRRASCRIGRLVDERVIVNAMVALLATGGSTNHLIHWVAVARAAGILIDWTDFSELSAAVPLLARVYPNGSADVNQFQAAGGPGFVLRELLDAGCTARRRRQPSASAACAPMPRCRRCTTAKLRWQRAAGGTAATRPSCARPRRRSRPAAA